MTRVWSGIKTKFKEEKIDSFRTTLLNFKINLLLAHQAVFTQVYCLRSGRSYGLGANYILVIQ